MLTQISLRNFGIVLAFLLTFFQAGCSKPEPILIGFSGQLSGAYADLGIKGRDGVSLAVEKINASGGIYGRPVKLLIRDDKGTPDGARTADRELIDAGVVAIIGHMTSSQAMAAMEVIETAGVVLISPTATTEELTGKWGFSSSQKPDFSRIAAEIHKRTPSALLIIASPLDTAFIAQKTRAIDFFNSNSKKPAFQEFQRNYKARFGRDPTFAGGTGYEAMLVLAPALKQTKGGADRLPEALKSIKTFEGPVGTICMDQYGDGVRARYRIIVQDGKFATEGRVDQ